MLSVKKKKEALSLLDEGDALLKTKTNGFYIMIKEKEEMRFLWTSDFSLPVTVREVKSLTYCEDVWVLNNLFMPYGKYLHGLDMNCFEVPEISEDMLVSEHNIPPRNGDIVFWSCRRGYNFATIKLKPRLHLIPLARNSNKSFWAALSKAKNMNKAANVWFMNRGRIYRK